jgi:predicted DNA-binding protein
MYKTVKPVTFTLDKGLIADLNALAQELGKKKTAIVSEALEMYMDYQDLKEAERRLDDPNDTIMDAESFFKELGV